MTVGDYTRVNFVDDVTELNQTNMNNMDAKIKEIDTFADAIPLDNLTATTDPTVNEDSGDGYGVGSSWVNVTLDKFFICVDATVGAAVWNDPGVASGSVLKTDYNAHTILQATSDNVPVAITIAEQRIVGRITAGNIKALTAAEVLTLIAVEAGADVTDAENVASTIFGAASKTTPVNADTVGITDSNASNALKKVTWANIKATLKTYFDTLYNLYSHPNHTGDVTSTGDGATVIGAGKVTEAMQILADNTTNNASTSKHGYVPKLSNVVTEFLNGQGGFTTPAGGSANADVPLTAAGCYLPITNPANYDEAEASTIYAGHGYLGFDDTTNESVFWWMVTPELPSTLNLDIYWYATATTGDVIWNIGLITFGDGDAWQSTNPTVTAIAADTVAGTTLYLNKTTVSAYNPTSTTNANEVGLLQLQRDAASGSDTLSGDAKVLYVVPSWVRT